MAGNISVGFKIEAGNGGLRNLIVDADALRKVMNATVTESEKLNKSFLNLAGFNTAMDSLSRTLGDIQGQISKYTAAWRTQAEVETQLAQVMRNTMGAREEEIQSIKDFCSAQQQVGIIGDEVQLAGAQELATYLELKSSLKGLIPVMNDMLAQQYGFAASAENASQIATMLGKVMEGQTGALRRYGYSFDEAQEKILKTGTEEERVAVLAEVVSQSVGGMNERLAQTPSGQMKQLSNAMGDLQEKVGKFAEGLEPTVSMVSGLTIGIMGAVKLGKGIVTTTKAISGLGVVTKTTASLMKTLGVQATAAKVAIKGLLISSGVGLAVWALSEAVQYLCGVSDKAAESAHRFATAQERAERASEMAAEAQKAESDARQEAVASLELYKTKIENFNGTKTEEQKLISELNTTYGDTMGYFSTLSGWYEALTKNSEDYCRQLVLETRTRKLANQIAELEEKKRDIRYNPDGTAKKYSKKGEKKLVGIPKEDVDFSNPVVPKDKKTGRAVVRLSSSTPYASVREQQSDLDKATESYEDYSRQQEALMGQMKADAKELAGISFSVKGTPTAPTAGSGGGGQSSGTHGTERRRSAVLRQETAPEGSIAAYESQIRDIEKKISFSVDAGEIAQLQMEVDKLKKSKEELENAAYGIKLDTTVKIHKEEFDKIQEGITPLTIPLSFELPKSDLAELPDPFEAGVDSEKKMEDTLGRLSGLAKQAGDAFRAMGEAFEVPALDAFGIIAGAIATMVQGFASASLQASSMGPWGWLAWTGAGLAALTTMVTSVKDLTAFADGGVVYGPTAALVGEYQGARSNPEVIAPLSKLRDIIEPTGAQPVVVGGVIRASGRTLEVVLENQSRIAGKSRGK